MKETRIELEQVFAGREEAARRAALQELVDSYLTRIWAEEKEADADAVRDLLPPEQGG